MRTGRLNVSDPWDSESSLNHMNTGMPVYTGLVLMYGLSRNLIIHKT